jgi:hypothetical protein
MAMIASHHADARPHKELTPQIALRYAWYLYLTLLTIPFFLFLYTVWSLLASSAPVNTNVPLTNGWFIGAVVYIILAAPASFFARTRFFHEYYKGGSVAPRDYLKGMSIVWIALEIGGLYALAGALATRALLPNFLVALAPLMMFVALWPSGRSMIARGRGASDDPQRYEEPR